MLNPIHIIGAGSGSELRSESEVSRDLLISGAVQRRMPELSRVLSPILDRLFSDRETWASLTESSPELFVALQVPLLALKDDLGDSVQDDADLLQVFERVMIGYIRQKSAEVMEHPKFPDFFDQFLDQLEARIGTMGALLLASALQESIIKVARRLIHDSWKNAIRDYKKASFEPLTGLLKKDVFERVRRREIERLFRDSKNRILAQFFIDLDKFKTINDTDSHAAGDRALVRFSQVIRSCFRGLDTIGRIGGDEFGVVVVVKNKVSAKRLAERLRCAVEAEFKDDSVAVTASIGIGFCNPNGMRDTLEGADIPAWLDHASSTLGIESDFALSVAKHARGRNNAVRYDQIGSKERKRACLLKAEESQARKMKV